MKKTALKKMIKALTLRKDETFLQDLEKGFIDREEGKQRVDKGVNLYM